MTNSAGTTEHPANQPFEHNGEWRSYDDAGRLLRWDAPNERWLPVVEARPAPAVGPATNEYRFSSLRQPALWVYAMLGASLLTTIFYMFAVMQQIAVIQDLQDPASLSNFGQLLQDAENADDLAATGVALQLLTLIATAAVFIWWVRRATCNVYALRSEDPAFTPGWAVGWWFIPFANLVQPLRVVNQAWRASDPQAVVSPDRTAWKRASVSAIVLAWWVVWVASNFGSGVAGQAYDSAEQLDSLEAAAIAVLIAEAGLLVAAGLAFLVVRTLTNRHDIAARLQSAGVTHGDGF